MKEGGFVDNIDQFDAPFFRITPREAADLDVRYDNLPHLNSSATTKNFARSFLGSFGKRWNGLRRATGLKNWCIRWHILSRLPTITG